MSSLLFNFLSRFCSCTIWGFPHSTVWFLDRFSSFFQKLGRFPSSILLVHTHESACVFSSKLWFWLNGLAIFIFLQLFLPSLLVISLSRIFCCCIIFYPCSGHRFVGRFPWSGSRIHLSSFCSWLFPSPNSLWNQSMSLSLAKLDRISSGLVPWACSWTSIVLPHPFALPVSDSH